MKIFKDKELTQEVLEVDLGIVPAGETKEYIFYLLNDTAALLKDLVTEIPNKEVTMIKSPVVMQPKESAELIFSWSPSITLKQGLKTVVSIAGIELWS